MDTNDQPTQHAEDRKQRIERRVKRLAVVTTIGMFVVVMMGSTVTNTGSGEGCGKSWPLCQGQFIPEYAVETAIEFSHRIVTAIEGILIAATAIGALYIRRGNREIKIFVAIMIGTLLLQSGLGAAAVMWPQSPKILAAHFGISMTAFAAVFLLTRDLYEDQSSTSNSRHTSAASALPSWYRYGTWGMLVGSVIVAYIGAYMRHSGNEMACYEWPSCNGSYFPGFTGPEGIGFSHRLAAVLLMALVYTITVWAYSMRDQIPSFWRVNAAASVFITLQALAGGAVVLSELDLWTTLAHAALMAWFFVFVTDACRQVLKVRQALNAHPAELVPSPSGATSGD